MPQLKTKWGPHPGQEEVRESDARFRIIACGRRWGKTELAAHELFETAYENPDSLCWWVAPDYRIADIGYSKVKEVIPSGFITNEKESKPKRLDLDNGAAIEFRSAGKKGGLVGEGIAMAVIDEASKVPEMAWKQEMRPTLSDTLGDMLAISTPQGQNWFHDYFNRGQNEDDEEFENISSWQRPTKSNPHIKNSEVEAAKRELPARIFNQEYRAIFVDDSGGVFERVRDRIVDPTYDWEKVDGEPPYYIGVDFAMVQDWTVIIVLDGTGKLVHYWRDQHCSWPTVQRAIEDAYAAYEGRVYVDGTQENKIISDLENVGVPVEPVKFTQQRKVRMIENLITAVEHEEITIPAIPQLITEMQVMEYDTTRADNVSYHAPEQEGYHDDTVDALALSNWARVGGGKKEVNWRNKTAGASRGSWLS